jgi:hypothetical protein
MPLTVDDGELIRKDPDAIRVYTWDYDDENLSATATIISSVWVITAIAPSTTDTALIKDSESILAGSRKTQLRLSAGTYGQKYQVTNRITTNESPLQGKDKSIWVLIEQE